MQRHRGRMVCGSALNVCQNSLDAVTHDDVVATSLWPAKQNRHRMWPSSHAALTQSRSPDTPTAKLAYPNRNHLRVPPLHEFLSHRFHGRMPFRINP